MICYNRCTAFLKGVFTMSHSFLCYEEGIVTPDNFIDIQMSQCVYFLTTGKFVLSDDELEDIVMSPRFKNYSFTQRDTDFITLLRERNLLTKRTLAEKFLDTYNK